MPGAPVARVSLPGNDVLDNVLQEMAVLGENPLLKIMAYGMSTITYTEGVGGSAPLFVHNLGYVPRVIVMGQIYDPFSDTIDTDFREYPSNESNSSQTIYHDNGYDIDTTTLSINVMSEGGGSGSGSHTIDIMWIVYFDEDI